MVSGVATNVHNADPNEAREQLKLAAWVIK